MQKISSISFRGIKQSQKSKNNANIASPIEKERGTEALPVCGKSLAVKPLPSKKFLDETDLVRYKKVQEEWAKSFSQRYNVPFENVIARLPEIKILTVDKDKRHLKDNIESFVLGGFSFNDDTIEINPVRKITNLYGGDEGRIVHETVHGYFHHLRRDYIEHFTETERNKIVSAIINEKMLDGEMGYTLRINENNPEATKVIEIPILSTKERKALVNFITTLNGKEYLDQKLWRLNEKGKKLLKEKLLPKLTDYSKTFSPTTEVGDDRLCEKIEEYIDATFCRRGLIVGEFKIGKPRENLLLTKIEQEMASESIEQLPELFEGSYLASNSKLPGYIEAYFMSTEELLARKESSIFRLERVNQKIKDMEAKGIKPSKILLKEQKIQQSNIRLIELVEAISVIEKQMIASEKQTEIIKKINTKRNRGAKKLKVKNADELSEFLKTKKGWTKIVANKKVEILWGTVRPERLLTDTNRNGDLKEIFEDLIKQIKAISVKSDLTAIPKRFTKLNLKRIMRKIKDRVIFAYWRKRLK